MGTSGVSAATYGSGTNVFPIITVDALGRITSATTGTMSGGGGSVSYISGSGTANAGSGTLNLAIGNTVGGTSGAGTAQLLIGNTFTCGGSSDVIAIIDNQSGTTVLQNSLGSQSITIGMASSNNSGTQLGALGSGAIAIGIDAQAAGVCSIAIGNGKRNGIISAAGQQSIVIGNNANDYGNQGCILISDVAGALSKTQQAIIIGDGSIGSNQNLPIIIGQNTNGIGSNSGAAIAIGPYTTIGTNCTDSIAIGKTANSGAANNIIIGQGCNGFKTNSTIIGSSASDNNPYTFNWAPGKISSQGDMCVTKILWAGTTVNVGTATEIFLANVGTNRFTLGTNSAWSGDVMIIGRISGGSACYIQNFQGVAAARGTGSGSGTNGMAAVGNLNNLGSNVVGGTAVWGGASTSINYDLTNNAIGIKVTAGTGSAGTAATVYWAAYGNGVYLGH